jgi:hypothetical protein
MTAYEIKVRSTNHPGAVSQMAVEAFDRRRSGDYPVFEASWRKDGTPFDAYRLKEDNVHCEPCQHSDIPAALYNEFIEELERVAETIKLVAEKAEGSHEPTATSPDEARI